MDSLDSLGILNMVYMCSLNWDCCCVLIAPAMRCGVRWRFALCTVCKSWPVASQVKSMHQYHTLHTSCSCWSWTKHAGQQPNMHQQQHPPAHLHATNA
eukprot:3875671-Amphidinium_carterae.1